MPQDLDIDYKRVLDGSIVPYSEHLLLHTSTNDWPSRIEDDERYPLAKILKTSLRKSMINHRPEKSRNLLITTTTSPTSTPETGSDTTISLLKSGIQIQLETSHADGFIQSLLVDDFPDLVLSKRSTKSTKPIKDITILICGHGSRDDRCGVMGPLLLQEFSDQLLRKGIHVRSHTDEVKEAANSEESCYSATLGLTSHIGGHTLAGNVIIYLPSTGLFKKSPLAGRGIWYGRVEPRHVEGIIQKTILDGVVIEELKRGVV
jgi:(2Fe-2S) ferredoxin